MEDLPAKGYFPAVAKTKNEKSMQTIKMPQVFGIRNYLFVV
jgi:hypothetical protein